MTSLLNAIHLLKLEDSDGIYLINHKDFKQYGDKISYAQYWSISDIRKKLDMKAIKVYSILNCNHYDTDIMLMFVINYKVKYPYKYKN